MNLLFCQYVSELVFGVNVFDLDFGVQIIRSKNQSRATLSVLETCLIVGLFDDHFNRCFVILKIYSIAPNREDFASFLFDVVLRDEFLGT